MTLNACFPPDTFGDRFDLHALPLPRLAIGYAIQMLNTDQLLDQATGNFLPVRSKTLEASFVSFDDAFEAASQWIVENKQNPDGHQLTIVPVGYDEILERHVLIYGVLCDNPKEFPETYPA